MVRSESSVRGRASVSLLLALSLLGALVIHPPATALEKTRATSTSTTTADEDLAGVAPGDDPEIVSGRWVVRAAEGRLDAVLDEALALGATVTFRYDETLNGFAASMGSSTADRLRADDRVDSVRPVQRLSFEATQGSAPWDLDRIDQRARPLDKTYNWSRNGKGVHVYVVDTGVRADHAEFEGRVLTGLSGQGTTSDCMGHGTHVAGTIAGKTYGVAKKATIIPVRVGSPARGCSIDSDRLFAGLTWVVKHHRSGVPAVANLSLGGWGDPDLDAAVRKVIADGVTVVVSAGNSGGWACDYSPARVPGALTVAATDHTDYSPNWSNFGSCIDIFAPGVGIRAASHGSRTGNTVMDGTSMAAPHVAGAAALYLQAKPGASPKTVHDALNAAATTGKVTNGGPSTANRLLYVKGVVPTRVALAVPSSAPAGNPLAVKATLTNEVSGTAIKGHDLRLYVRRTGTTSWSSVTTKTTGSDGKVSFTHTPKQAVEYQVRHADTSVTAASVSPIRSVSTTTTVTATALTLAGPTSAVTVGSKASLAAALRTGSGTALSGRPVQLQSRRPGASSWSAVTTGTTDAGGKITFARSPTRNNEYRATFAGSSSHAPSSSMVATVLVGQRVDASLHPEVIADWDEAELTARITPEPPEGESVTIQLQRRNDAGVWELVDDFEWGGSVWDDPNPGWNIWGPPGEYHLRMRALKTSRNALGTSSAVTLTITSDDSCEGSCWAAQSAGSLQVERRRS